MGFTSACDQFTTETASRRDRLQSKALEDFARVAVAPLHGVKDVAQWAKDRKAYIDHYKGSVAMATQVIANAVARIELDVSIERETKAGVTYEPAPRTHPLVKLLRRPNARHLQFDLLWLLVGFRVVTGDAYCWKIRNGLRVPAELWTLPSTWVWAIPDRERYIGAYQVRAYQGQEPEVIPAEDIIQISSPNLDWSGTSRYYGRSTMTNDAEAIDSESAMWKRLIYTFENYSPPGLHYETEEVLNPVQIEEAIIDIKNQHAIAEHTGNPIFSTAGWKAKEFRQSVREMDYVKSLEFTMDWQLAQRGVPKALVGFIKEYSRANIVGAMTVFTERTVQPLQIHTCQHLTEQLAKDFDEKLVVSQRPAAPNDVEESRQRWDIAVKQGAATIDEFREAMLDLGPLPDGRGSQVLVPSSMIPIDTVGEPQAGGESNESVRDHGVGGRTISVGDNTRGTDAGGSVPAESGAGDGAGSDSVGDNRSILRWSGDEHAKAWIKQHGRTERRFADAISRYFRQQKRRVLARLKQYASLQVGDETKLLPAGEEDKLLASVAMRQVEAGMIRGAQLEWSRYGKAASPIADIDDPRIDIPPEIRERIREELRRAFGEDYWHKVGINGATRVNLRYIIEKAIKEGGGVRQMAKAIQKDPSGNWQDWRAWRVARTESTGAVNGGQWAVRQEAMAEGLVDGEEWSTTLDDATRPEHMAANGQKIKPGGMFTVGGEQARYPGDPNLSAGNRINCRCVTVSVIGPIE